MIREQHYVALFQSTHRVLAAEKLLKQEQVPFTLLPAPRELSSACGLAISYDPELAATIDRLLSAAGLRPADLFIREETGFRKLKKEG